MGRSDLGVEVEEQDGFPSLRASKLILPDGSITDNGDGTADIAFGGGGSALTVQDIDGTPTVSDVSIIRFSNGSVTDDGGGQVTVATGGGGGGGGDVSGPGSSTDNAITRFDSTSGKIIQNSGVTIDDSNNIAGLNNVTGADANLVSGTAGTSGNLVEWDANGDAVDSGSATSDFQGVLAEGAFVDGDKTKLDGIETAADVTDAANVTAAGALMDSELTSIADVKALNQSVVNGAAPVFATTNMTEAADKNFITDAEQTKLSGIETAADVTDTANVTAAGALMDSELTSIADVKALNQSVISGAAPVLATTNMTEGTDKNFVTDAEATVLGNTSGTNTGDQTNITGNAATVTTNANLTGHVTSVGNAAVLGSFTLAQLNTAISDGTVIEDVEGTAVLSTGEAGGTKFLREDGDGTCSWQSVPGGGGAVELIKAITIESPTSSEDITMFFSDVAITISQMNAVLLGSSTPSVTWTVRHDTDRSATGNEVVTSGTTTTSTTTGSEVTSFNDATIPAGSWVWMETTAQSGTVTELSLSLEYTID